MGRRIVSAAAVLSVCTTLMGAAWAGVFVLPESSVAGSKRAIDRLNEIPIPLIYEGDPSEFIRTDDRLEKKASNLGSRLMCQLDSRNCGTFNMGKKFGRFSWLRSADSTWRRLQYELGGHRWERGVEAGRDSWRDDEDSSASNTQEEERPTKESDSRGELRVLRME